VWHRFETLRNKLPVVDHGLIAAAEASDLPGSHCFSNMTRFLVRILHLSPGEAASRVRAAAAVGPRSSMLGEKLEPQLPQLAQLQREGQVSAAKVAIVERAMHQLTRPGLDSRAVQTAEQLLTDHAPLLGQQTCSASHAGWSMPPTRTAPNPSTINCSRTGGISS
jgi:hypothetical protein